MSTTATRWNLVVSKETDIALRQFLASEGGGRKGDLSRFVEEAVKERIYDMTARAIKNENASKSPEEIEEIVEEALA
ncbi:MAG: ribbon-helix-helix domain-containing protein [Terracidiphilus sp.]